MFGENFENYEAVGAAAEAAAEAAAASESGAGQPKAADKAKKGKILAKATGLKYQFQILESIGVPLTEVKKFADPYHWLEYFPPIAIVSTSCDFSAAAKMKLRMQYHRQTIVLWAAVSIGAVAS